MFLTRTFRIVQFYFVCQLVLADVSKRVYYVAQDTDVGEPAVGTCGNRTSPCRSLKSVFAVMRGVYVEESTDVHFYVILLPTVHQMEYGTAMDVAGATSQSRSVSLSLMGEDLEHTNITCIGNSSRGGLVFSGLDSLVMMNVTVTDCVGGGHSQSPIVSVRNSRNLAVKSCRFSENEGVAIDIRNVRESVLISHCHFSASQTQLSSGIRFTVDSDLALMYGAMTVAIEFCQFVNLNNMMYVPSDKSVGYGAGIGIFVSHTAHPLNISIVSSRFEENTALSGAGVYARVETSSQNLHVLIDNCTFTDCQAKGTVVEQHIAETEGGHGGAVGVFFFGESKGQFDIKNSVFDSNHAITGAGIALFFAEHSTKVQVTVAQSNFTRNIGGQSGALSVNNVMSQGNWPMPVICRNTWFVDNMVVGNGVGSAIVAIYADLSLEGETVVKSNNGSAVLVLGGSWLVVSGVLMFSENRGHYGGAVYMYGHATIRVSRGTILYFTNNSALVHGGALFVSNAGVELSWLELGLHAQNHRCFIVPYIDYDVNRNRGNLLNATIRFVDNTAGGTGGAIYASSLDVCAWKEKDNGLNFTTALKSSSFFYHNNLPVDISSEIASVHTKVTVDIEHAAEQALHPNDARCPDNQTVYCIIPGIAYRLYVSGTDVLDHEVNGPAVVTTGSDDLGVVDYHEQLVLRTNLSHEFSVFAGRGWKHIYFSGVQHQTRKLIIEHRAASLSSQQLYVRLVDCIVGYKYDKTHETCLCNNGHDTHVLECRYDGGVKVEQGYWVGRVRSGGPLASYSCPAGYCRCPNGTCWFDPRVQPDAQCVEGRNGTLCGECIDGYSVAFGSLYSRCKADCTDEYKWQLPVFALFSVIVVAIAVVINLNVASGVIRSFVFYLQIVGFILNAIPPGGILSYSWVSYLVGIPNLNIRVDACMWKDMTSLQSTALQYFIPACIFICMALFVLLARKFAPVSRIHVLRPFWSLVTLTYVSIAYTTFMLLQCVPLEDGDDYYWFGDGNVRCFTSSHVPYAILAIIIAVFYIIPFPFFVAFFLPRISRLKPVSDIGLQAFKEPFWWGEGWNFGQRLLIVIIHCFSSTPYIHQTLVILFLSIFLSVHAQLQPYLLFRNNVIETCLLFNLVVVTALQIYTTNNPVPSPVTEVVFLLPYVAVCVLLVCYMWQRYRKREKQETGSMSSIRYDNRNSTVTSSVSRPLSVTSTNKGPGDTSSLPRSFEQDAIMDESNDGLREPLLSLLDSQ